MSEASLTRRPPAQRRSAVGPTLQVAALLTVMCSLEYLWRALDQPGLLRMGANYGHGVASGQWARLLTSGWLHAGAVHLFLTVLILAWCRPLEGLIGKHLWIAVYAVCGLAGALVQAAVEPSSPAVTGSAAAAGMLAVTAWRSAHASTRLWSLSRRQAALAWVGVAVAQLLALTVPGAGLLAPAAGMAAGLGCALALPAVARRWGASPAVRGAAWLWWLASAASIEWVWSVTRPWQ